MLSNKALKKYVRKWKNSLRIQTSNNSTSTPPNVIFQNKFN